LSVTPPLPLPPPLADPPHATYRCLTNVDVQEVEAVDVQEVEAVDVQERGQEEEAIDV
tara:strand:+ start:296 stop:469 length:174 start_codon:yes stop_codon:yes gene_type:complete